MTMGWIQSEVDDPYHFDPLLFDGVICTGKEEKGSSRNILRVG